MNGTIRAFVAVEFDDAIRERLVAEQERLRTANADVRWVSRESLHVTLKFCGDVAEESIEALQAACGIAAGLAAAADVQVRGIGVFPTRGAPRVVWAGIDDPSNVMSRLASSLERGAEPLGIPREERPFSPHLTIGRVKSAKGSDRLLKSLESRKAVEFGVQSVCEIVLFKSDLRPEGATYTALGRYPLETP